jgi:hypothetical protein
MLHPLVEGVGIVAGADADGSIFMLGDAVHGI